MEKLTITEALSEINLIKKKTEKKETNVLSNLYRAKHIKDQLEKEGGSKTFVYSEIQAIKDLMKRYIKIKGAIAKANIENQITVNDKTMSIHDWLNWKRDCSKGEIEFNTKIHNQVKNHFDAIQRQPQVFKDDEGKTHLVEFESNVEYGDFLKSAENLQETFDKLDGQLSLKNATIVVELQ